MVGLLGCTNCPVLKSAMKLSAKLLKGHRVHQEWQGTEAPIMAFEIVLPVKRQEEGQGRGVG